MDDFLHSLSSFHDGKLHERETAVSKQFVFEERFFDDSTRWQPGLAFFYGGLVHRNSVMTIMMQVKERISFSGNERIYLIRVVLDLPAVLLLDGLDRNDMERGWIWSRLRRKCRAYHRESRILPIPPEHGPLHSRWLPDVERPQDPGTPVLRISGTIRCVLSPRHILLPRPFDTESGRGVLQTRLVKQPTRLRPRAADPRAPAHSLKKRGVESLPSE